MLKIPWRQVGNTRSKHQELPHTNPAQVWAGDFRQVGPQFAEKHISRPKPLYLAIKANVLSGLTKPARPALNMFKGTVKLSRICPFCGRILLDQRLRINDLAVATGGENAAKLLNLTVPSRLCMASLMRWA